MKYVRLTEFEHDRLQRDAKLAREYINRVHQAELFVLAAIKCGFVSLNQYDALIIALHKLTALETWLVELLLNIKPRQLR